jgi:hypothetical protein
MYLIHIHFTRETTLSISKLMMANMNIVALKCTTFLKMNATKALENTME